MPAFKAAVTESLPSVPDKQEEDVDMSNAPPLLRQPSVDLAEAGKQLSARVDALSTDDLVIGFGRRIGT